MSHIRNSFYFKYMLLWLPECNFNSDPLIISLLDCTGVANRNIVSLTKGYAYNNNLNIDQFSHRCRISHFFYAMIEDRYEGWVTSVINREHPNNLTMRIDEAAEFLAINNMND
jgi:hypothetical protein